METLDQFIKANTGKKLDYDGVWPGQCVDGARCYLRDCFGVAFEPPPMPGADDWAKPFPHLTWIKNDVGNASQYPKRGDIVVWGQDAKIGTGPFGHISVFVSGTGTVFDGFEQNWPVGAAMHIQHHGTYEGVLGWLRPIPLPVPAPPPAPAPPPQGKPLPDPNEGNKPSADPGPAQLDLWQRFIGWLVRVIRGD